MGHQLLLTIHVLAVLLWVGGMAFAHFFLRPALAELEPPHRLRLMRGVLGRFLRAVGVAVALILASGLWMLARVPPPWPWDWWLMAGVGLLMSGIYGHIRWVPFPRLARAVDSADWPAAAAALAQVRRWVGVNLALGVALVAVVLLF